MIMKPSRPTKTKTFGQARAQRMQNSLHNALKERNSLLRKEFASPEPLSSLYQYKGQQLDVKIRKLKDDSRK